MNIAGEILAKFSACASGAIDLLLPNVCMACSSEDTCQGGLCESCNVKLLSLVARPYCHRCGSGLGDNVPHGPNCRGCPPTLPRFDSVVRLGPYAEPLRAVVRELKYHRQEALRRRLGKLLAAAVSSQVTRPLDLVLSVPMHWRRRLARGYDHAKILAQTLSTELQLPLGHELIRIRHTPPQAHLPKSRRLENMRGAFAVQGLATIKGAAILLVDDVTTTGATGDEASRELLKAGAASVTLAVIAKAEPPSAYSEVRVND